MFPVPNDKNFGWINYDPVGSMYFYESESKYLCMYAKWKVSKLVVSEQTINQSCINNYSIPYICDG